jgi:hypothetical protein
MGAPTSEVGYTIATTRMENHEVHKNRWWHSLYLRSKIVPLPSLSLYPLYSDVYLQMARLKAVVFVFAPLLPPHVQLAQPETCWRPSTSLHPLWWKQPVIVKRRCSCAGLNLLAPELFFLILAHSVYKMWIIQDTNKLGLRNKLHYKKKKTESIHHV